MAGARARLARSGEQETVWSCSLTPKPSINFLPSTWGVPILSSRNNRIIFLDGFAGPGVYKDDKPGSQCKALDVLLNHSHGSAIAEKEFVFIFNETDQARYEKLATRQSITRGLRTSLCRSVTMPSRTSSKAS